MSIVDYAADVFKNPEKYAKFWIAFAAAVLNLIGAYFPDQPWLPILINFAAALGVVIVPNKK